MNIEQTLRVLMGVFLAQGLLATITWWPRGEGPVELRDLVEVDAAELKSITITGSVRRNETADEPIVIERSGDGWIIPSVYGVKALDSKMDSLLSTIDKLEVRRPVAENAYRHADLDVASDQHTRKLVLDTGEGEPLTIYLGSATGSAAHVRVDGENDVFKVRGVTGYSISTAANQYFDRDILGIDASLVDELRVQRTDSTGFTFTKLAGLWTVDTPAPAGKAIDQTRAADFVTKVLTIQMREPVGSTATPDMGLDNPTVVTWTSTEDGATVTGRYEVGTEVDGRVHVRIQGQPYIYDVLSSQVENATTLPLTSVFDVTP